MMSDILGSQRGLRPLSREEKIKPVEGTGFARKIEYGCQLFNYKAKASYVQTLKSKIMIL